MDIQEITNRNYAATVKRGQINEKTCSYEFINNLFEELYKLEDTNHSEVLFDEKKLADVALVCFAMAKHYEIDLIKVMEEKMLYNEIRKD